MVRIQGYQPFARIPEKKSVGLILIKTQYLILGSELCHRLLGLKIES